MNAETRTGEGNLFGAGFGFFRTPEDGSAGCDLMAEVLEGALQPLVAVHLRLPAQQLPRPRDVWLADLRVVLRQRLEYQLALRAAKGQDLAGELQDRHLAGVAEVDRLVELGKQQPVDALDQVADVAERAGLR